MDLRSSEISGTVSSWNEGTKRNIFLNSLSQPNSFPILFPSKIKPSTMEKGFTLLVHLTRRRKSKTPSQFSRLLKLAHPIKSIQLDSPRFLTTHTHFPIPFLALEILTSIGTTMPPLFPVQFNLANPTSLHTQITQTVKAINLFLFLNPLSHYCLISHSL